MCTSKLLINWFSSLAKVFFNLCPPLSFHAMHITIHSWICRKIWLSVYIYQIVQLIFGPTFNLLSLTWHRQLGSGLGYKMTSTDRIAEFNSALWRTIATTSVTKPSWRAGFIAEYAEMSCTFCINQLLRIINELRYINICILFIPLRCLSQNCNGF